MRTASLVAVSLLAAGCAAGPAMERQNLTVTLNGLQEVPGPGDPDGTGTAEVRVDPRNDRVCWDLAVRQVDAATAAHIHRGAAGAAGPPVVALTTPAADGRSSGCATVDPALAAELSTRSHDFYVNVHTAAFPNGAVRGQLRGAMHNRRQPIGP